MPVDSVRCLLVGALALSALLLPGCRKDPAVKLRAKAEAAVEKALDAWARGESPEKFAQSGQLIRVTEPDWQAGVRLVSSLISETTQSQDKPEHVRCRVALSLQDRKGKKAEKEVEYDVEVGDTIVIARASR
jgi:hypothetical protein